MANQRRWSRSESLYSAPPVDTWPTVNIDSLLPESQETFLLKVEAIQLYAQGHLGAEIKKRTGIQPSTLSKITKRCLEMGPDGQIMGYRALIPYLHLKAYERKSIVKGKRQEQKGGHAGALGALLNRMPGIELALLSLIKKEAKFKGVHEHRIRPKDIHQIFLGYLKENGITNKEWPFNTKYLGIRSIQIYMNNILSSDFDRTVSTREEQVAKAHLPVGKGIEPLMIFEEPFDAVELDAYDINAFLSVAFQTPEGGLTDVLLDRLWLLAMADRTSNVVIAHSIVYSSEVSSEDVIRVIRNAAFGKWKPKGSLIAGLQYPESGGMPSGVLPECQGAMWGCILLDGALAHLSKNIYELARTKLGFNVNWGPAGHFERRPNIERLFKHISDEIFMRFPSTTGANPGNGRAKDAEKKATRYRIRASEVEDLLDVFFAQYNATPTEGLSYRSPLEYLEIFVKDENNHFLMRHLPENTATFATPLCIRKECKVRGGIKNGRRPYIELDGVRYTSPTLSQLYNLIGQNIIVECDEEDYRQVRAFLENGAELGFLSATGKWAQTKHSIKTRKIINRLKHRRLLVISEFDDPVQAYLSYLSMSSKSKRSEKNHPSSKNATEATRVAIESGLDLFLPTEEHVDNINPDSSSQVSGDLMDKPFPDLNEIINRQR